MASYGDVRRWRPGPLDDTEQQLKRKVDGLLRLNDEFADMATPREWTGDAADSARREHGRITDRIEEIVASVSAARSGIGNAADAIIGLGHAVEEAEELARAHGFAISDDGAVNDVTPPQDVPEDQLDEVRRERQLVQAEVADRVEQILRRAEDIDNDLADVLSKVCDDEIGDDGATTLAAAASAGAAQGGLSVLEPPKRGSPGDNAGWWETLSDKEKQQILRDHPEWVGNRDGLPSEDRDKANRAILANQKAQLEGEARRLQADIDDNWFGGLFTDADDRLAEIRAKLEGISNIESHLDSTKDSAPGERHYLLGFDASGDGKAILAKGNPDTAANVATFVPGTGSDLANFSRDQAVRGDAMWGAAERAGSDSTSVITWLGYDAPDGLTDAVNAEPYAYDAREPLDDFQDGLRVAHEGDPSHNTIVGHSYGSTVAGIAARDEQLDVDEFVAVGSPGVGVQEVSALNVGTDNVWAIAAENDPVADLEVHGNSPTDSDFGANIIHASPGHEWPIIEYSDKAHSQYWEPNNPSLRGMGQVVAGEPVR